MTILDNVLACSDRLNEPYLNMGEGREARKKNRWFSFGLGVIDYSSFTTNYHNQVKQHPVEKPKKRGRTRKKERKK